MRVLFSSVLLICSLLCYQCNAQFAKMMTLDGMLGRLNSTCNQIPGDGPVCLELKFDEVSKKWSESKCYPAGDKKVSLKNEKWAALEQFTVKMINEKNILVCSSTSKTRTTQIGLIAHYLNEKFSNGKKTLYISKSLGNDLERVVFSEDATSKRNVISSLSRNTILDDGSSITDVDLENQNSIEIVSINVQKDRKGNPVGNSKLDPTTKISGESTFYTQLFHDKKEADKKSKERQVELFEMRCPDKRKYLTLRRTASFKFLAELVEIEPFNTNKEGRLQLNLKGNGFLLFNSHELTCEAVQGANPIV